MKAGIQFGALFILGFVLAFGYQSVARPRAVMAQDYYVTEPGQAFDLTILTPFSFIMLNDLDAMLAIS